MLRKTIYLSTAALVILTAAAALSPMLDSRIYAREALSWAMQGMGQDIVTLVVVLPALIISAILAGRGSIRAFLVWLGLLIYLIYSYILYSFFIHFGPLFLVYIAVLGTSFYALIISLANITPEKIASSFSPKTPIKLLSWYLYIFTALFIVLWLADILQGLAAGAFPKNISELGLPVNPIEVLDLAFFFPGVAITGYLLQKKRPLGYLFTAPVLVFGVFMGLAVIGMTIVMAAHKISFSLGPVISMFTATLASLIMLVVFLRETNGVVHD